jgi:hypothetical protein
MTLLADVLSWLAIAFGVVGASLALYVLVARRAKGRPVCHAAASTPWRTLRSCCGVVLLSLVHWVGGIAVWLLLAAGVWLLVAWDLASWLRTRYRLTRIG